MKIITNNALYVQKVDIDFLKYRLHSLPQFISSKIYENSELDIADFNKYDFFKLEDKNDIDFFKSVDWLFEYNFVKDLTTEEITEIGRQYVEKREQIAKKLYSVTDDIEYKNILLQYTLTNYQIASLNDIIDFKLGLLKMNLPDVFYSTEVLNQKKGIRKLIKSIFYSKN